MRALQFETTGRLSNLRQVDLPRPVRASEEVLIAVRAARINRSDVSNVLGRHPHTTLPRVPGRDFVGHVVEGPADLVGQLVWGSGSELGFVRDGSHAELLLLSRDAASMAPTSLTPVEAATCGVPYITAWLALEACRLERGHQIAVLGANGAVGQAVVALARWRGADVLAAVRESSLFGTGTVDGVPSFCWRSEGDLAEGILKQFPGGAQAVVDTTGRLTAPAVRALGPLGCLVVMSAPEDGQAMLPLRDLYRRGGQVVGVNSLSVGAVACAPILRRLASAFDAGQLRPPPTHPAFAFAEALAAYDHVNEHGGGAMLVM